MAIDAIKVAEEESKLAEASQAQRDRQRTIQHGLRYASMVLMLAMVAAALLMISRRLGAAPGPRAAHAGGARAHEDAGVAAGARRADEPGMDTVELTPVGGGAANVADGAPEADPALARRLAELGTQSPEDFARQLRGWMRAGVPADGPRGERN